MNILQTLAVLLIAPKLRYLISGAAIALLLGLFCRGIDRLFRPLSLWKRFSGTVTAAERRSTGTLLTVSFADRRRMQHTAVFSADADDAPEIGSPLRFVMERTMFESGNIPDSAEHAHEAAGKILTYPVYRRLLLRQFLHELLIQLLIWLAAFLLCAAAVHFCFPHP